MMWYNWTELILYLYIQFFIEHQRLTNLRWTNHFPKWTPSASPPKEYNLCNWRRNMKIHHWCQPFDFTDQIVTSTIWLPLNQCWNLQLVGGPVFNVLARGNSNLTNLVDRKCGIITRALAATIWKCSLCQTNCFSWGFERFSTFKLLHTTRHCCSWCPRNHLHWMTSDPGRLIHSTSWHSRRHWGVRVRDIQSLMALILKLMMLEVWQGFVIEHTVWDLTCVVGIISTTRIAGVAIPAHVGRGRGGRGHGRGRANQQGVMQIAPMQIHNSDSEPEADAGADAGADEASHSLSSDDSVDAAMSDGESELPEAARPVAKAEAARSARRSRGNVQRAAAAVASAPSSMWDESTVWAGSIAVVRRTDTPVTHLSTYAFFNLLVVAKYLHHCNDNKFIIINYHYHIIDL